MLSFKSKTKEFTQNKIENDKKEEVRKAYVIENIIEEVHEVEDTNVEYVANDILKQSEELHQRLAERRRRLRHINS